MSVSSFGFFWVLSSCLQISVRSAFVKAMISSAFSLPIYTVP